MTKMNSYERVMACFSREKLDRVPVLPVVREWCCKQAGIKFSDAVDNVEKYVYSQYYCAKRFGYDVVLDLTAVHAESEAMGSVVKYGDGYLPMIQKPAIKNYEEDLPRLKILNPHKDGRLPMILEGISRLKELCGREIPVMAYVQCPFRHANMLRGTDMLMKDIFKQKENARLLLEIATVSQIIWGIAVVQAGADIVWFGDPTSSGDVISAQMYKEWGFPYTQQVVSAIKKTGVKTILHICGDTSDRLEMMAATGVDVLSLDSKVDFGFAREKMGRDCLLLGNVDPTDPLTIGTPEKVYENSKEVIANAGKDGRLFLSGGCLISDEVPAQNMEAMIRAAHESVY